MGHVSMEGRVAIVTGAARGLGRAYAMDLARHGAAVVVNDLPGGGAEHVVAEIEAAGGTAGAAEHNVAVPEEAAAVVAEALDRHGRVDALVNNAGMLRNAPFESLRVDQIRDIFAVHLAGTFHVTQRAFGAMREAGYGRIVNVGSNTAFGMAGLINYATAKAGILGLTTSLAIEGAEHGIHVNTVMPNARTTIMDEEPIPGFEADRRFMAAFEGVSHRYEPERTASLVTFLASDACTATGQHFSSLGGRYARVLYAVTEGWMTPGDELASADDVAEHFEEIADAERIALLPASITDEFDLVARALAT